MNTGIKEKQVKAYETLKEKLQLKNVMQTPKITKVVVSAVSVLQRQEARRARC